MSASSSSSSSSLSSSSSSPPPVRRTMLKPRNQLHKKVGCPYASIVSVKQAMKSIQHGKETMARAEEFIDDKVEKVAETLQNVVGRAVIVVNSKGLLVYVLPEDFVRYFLTDKTSLLVAIERQGPCNCHQLDDDDVDDGFQCRFHGFYRDSPHFRKRTGHSWANLDCQDITESATMKDIMNEISPGRDDGDAHNSALRGRFLGPCNFLEFDFE